MKNSNYICHVPYLRNSKTYDHDFWCTSVKWWYLQVFFHIFKILIFRVFREVKGQKVVQNDKTFCLSCSISQELCIIWFSFMVHVCKMIISPGFLFHFFKILIFWVVMEVKGQKMVKNDKKICLLRSIS